MAQEVGVRDIQELMQFGRDLQTLSEQLMEAFHQTERRMAMVCDGWNDQMNQQFMDVFVNDTKAIDKISERMSSYSAFIKRNCEILEMYRQNRM